MTRTLVAIFCLTCILNSNIGYAKSGPEIERPNIELKDAVNIANRYLHGAFDKLGKENLHIQEWLVTSVKWDRVRKDDDQGFVWFWRVRFEYPAMNEWQLELQVDQEGVARIYKPVNMEVESYLREQVRTNEAREGRRW